MLAKIYSAAVYGVDAYEVEIEVNGAGGDPVIVIVGLPDAAVKESRDRVTTAISNSGYYWPRGRTTINLAPADIKKEGPSFDLPIALGMIAVTEELDSSTFENFSFVGELALDGSVRSVKGVLPVALEARRRGKRALFVPEANALEAAMVDKIDIYGVQNLRQTFAFLREQILRRAPKLRFRFQRRERPGPRQARDRGGRRWRSQRPDDWPARLGQINARQAHPDYYPAAYAR